MTPDVTQEWIRDVVREQVVEPVLQQVWQCSGL